MRAVATATTADELPGVEAQLVGADSQFRDIVVGEAELRVPFGFVNPSDARFHLSLGLFPVGTAPVMRAYLLIRHVVAHDIEDPVGEGCGVLRELRYDEPSRRLTLGCASGLMLRVSVRELDVQALVSDEQSGERPLSMYM